jgi:hypothetical protein
MRSAGMAERKKQEFLNCKPNAKLSATALPTITAGLFYLAYSRHQSIGYELHGYSDMVYAPLFNRPIKARRRNGISIRRFNEPPT